MAKTPNNADTAQDTAPAESSPIVPEKAPSLKAEPKNKGKQIEVETTGDFMLFDPFSLEIVEANGTSKVTETKFIQSAIADGRLKTA